MPTKAYKIDGYVFRFDFVPTGGRFNIMVLHCPVNKRNTSEGVCHVNPETGKICIAAGREPKTLDRAVALAWHWASGYVVYQRTGLFPNGAAKRDV